MLCNDSSVTSATVLRADNTVGVFVVAEYLWVAALWKTKHVRVHWRLTGVVVYMRAQFFSSFKRNSCLFEVFSVS